MLKGIDLIRLLLKVNPKTEVPRLRIHKRCKHLIEEMRKYRWQRRSAQAVDGMTAAPQPQPLKKDDDTVSAMRYMLAGAMATEGMGGPDSMSNRPTEVRADVQLDFITPAQQLVPLMRGANRSWFGH